MISGVLKSVEGVIPPTDGSNGIGRTSCKALVCHLAVNNFIQADDSSTLMCSSTQQGEPEGLLNGRKLHHFLTVKTSQSLITLGIMPK